MDDLIDNATLTTLYSSFKLNREDMWLHDGVAFALFGRGNYEDIVRAHRLLKGIATKEEQEKTVDLLATCFRDVCGCNPNILDTHRTEAYKTVQMLNGIVGRVTN